ncbi:L-serine ammonia-lyase [Brevibacterium permense]|uniref:L-serine ammonia-lyase, iron-sulfur-dependent, subunit alpha n=1 Tax=Brevibacterium permense TaxID=234834 RepID=UPI0021CE7951|nr:L-serine ammonia-lyase, iron-sulfur-dependent, subunit alpha [Brevibacterium permense]MCU4296728.1 L-serine ammonia-lyase [Brevibacterium permense]
MSLGVLDLFSIGIGPSSSHTVGPMRAAVRFVDELAEAGLLERVDTVRVGLFGSLGATGIGHGSDSAVLAGLSGKEPETLDPVSMGPLVAEIRETGSLRLGGRTDVPFDVASDLTLHLRESLPGHPNGMRISAEAAGELIEREYYSVGGGFVVTADELAAEKDAAEAIDAAGDEAGSGGDGPGAGGRDGDVIPFSTADELLEQCRIRGLSIAELMTVNERTRQTDETLRARLLEIWSVMAECVHNGCTREETTLPGGLKVRRRAPELKAKLETAGYRASGSLDALEWVNLYALAVNEENASGGRIVTAPTNGAAGIIPAVLHYMDRFVTGDEGAGSDGADAGASEDGAGASAGASAADDAVVKFLLTAGAIGILFKRNASISGAEVGCQGEVGSACAMAAAGLCAVLGGTPEQVENAAEIGLEHNLGLTCDPVGGLVQVPCIERNAIASVKAINAARLAMHGDGSHRVSLDQAIETMRQTGADMKSKYKETSRGGLAVNVVEC